MVQVVTGDSQEEVMIFRYTQKELHHNIYIIITTIELPTGLNLDLHLIPPNVGIESSI